MPKSNELKHDSLIIGVNFPVKRAGDGTGLVGWFAWPVHNAANYKDRVPATWLDALGPRHAVYFMGAPDPTRYFESQGLSEHDVALDDNGHPRDREMWFDFQGMNSLDRHAAIVLGVQGLNALTGLPTSSEHKKGLYNGPGRPVLEQYPDVCPVHGVPFSDHQRTCELEGCRFKWPFQNYVTNSVTDPSFRFWWDGWRGADGEIQQFAMRPASSGMGVAQQVLGEDRALGLSLAVFLKKQPKPAPTMYRRPRPSWDELVPFSGGGDDEKEVYRGAVPMRGGSELSLGRVGASSRMEVAAGRTVDQKLYPDNSNLDEWRNEPEVIFTLIPVDMAWVAEVTKYGPTTREVAAGPFAGIRRVG